METNNKEDVFYILNDLDNSIVAVRLEDVVFCKFCKEDEKFYIYFLIRGVDEKFKIYCDDGKKAYNMFKDITGLKD